MITMGIQRFKESSTQLISFAGIPAEQAGAEARAQARCIYACVFRHLKQYITFMTCQ